jgi:hypothetical protein
MFSFRGVEVTMMKNADTFKLAFFIQIIENNLVQDVEIALFPLAVRTCRRSFKNVELGNKLDTELPASGNESTYVQNLAHVGGKCLVVGNKLLRTVQRFTCQARYLRVHKVIRVFYADIRAEVADHLVPPFVVEMIGVFQKLTAP